MKVGTRLKVKLWLIAIAMCISTGLSNYCTMYIPNTAQKVIQAFIRKSVFGTSTDSSVTTKLSILWSVFLVTAYPGLLIGSLIAPSLADKFGRKWCIRIAAFLEIPGHALLVMAQPCEIWFLLYFGRFIATLGYGMEAIAVTTFLNELSPSKMRGAIILTYPLFMAVGGLFGGVLGLESVLGTANAWPYAFIVPMVFSCFIFPLLQCIPESPQYLGAVAAETKDWDDGKEAEEALRYYHGNVKELDKMMENVMGTTCGEEHSGVRAVYALLTDSNLRRPTILATVIAAGECFTGGALVLSLSTSLINDGGLSYDTSQYLTIGLMCLNLISCLASLKLVDVLRRKILFFFGLGASVLLWGLIIFVQWFPSTARAICTVIIIFLAQVAVNIGIRSIYYVVVGEIFPYQYRAAGNAWACMFSCCLHIVYDFAFWPAYEVISNWVFLGLAIPTLLLGIYVVKIFPETKGKTAVEIYPELAFQNCDNDEVLDPSELDAAEEEPLLKRISKDYNTAQNR